MGLLRIGYRLGICRRSQVLGGRVERQRCRIQSRLVSGVRLLHWGLMWVGSWRVLRLRVRPSIRRSVGRLQWSVRIVGLVRLVTLLWIQEISRVLLMILSFIVGIRLIRRIRRGMWV